MFNFLIIYAMDFQLSDHLGYRVLMFQLSDHLGYGCFIFLII
jgi:hypothetical protein